MDDPAELRSTLHAPFDASPGEVTVTADGYSARFLNHRPGRYSVVVGSVSSGAYLGPLWAEIGPAGAPTEMGLWDAPAGQRLPPSLLLRSPAGSNPAPAEEVLASLRDRVVTGAVCRTVTVQETRVEGVSTALDLWHDLAQTRMTRVLRGGPSSGEVLVGQLAEHRDIPAADIISRWLCAHGQAGARISQRTVQLVVPLAVAVAADTPGILH